MEEVEFSTSGTWFEQMYFKLYTKISSNQNDKSWQDKSSVATDYNVITLVIKHL